MKKQVLLTGGLGFIGQHFVKRLIKENYYPIIVDNLSTSRLRTLRTLNLFQKSKFSFIKCDITNQEKLEKNLAKFQPKIITHLAAIHFIPFCNKNPKKTLLVNTLGTQILINFALKRKIRYFLFASSGAVYKPSTYPHKENDVLKPIDIYGLSKKLAEELIKSSNLKFIILRIFNVYGSNDSTPHFIPTLLTQLKKSNKIKLGSLNTYRDYIYIDDVINALMKYRTAERCGIRG